MTICLLMAGVALADQTKMITQTPKMKMTIPIPEKITTPDKVKTPIGTLEFFDGIPIGDTKESVYDYADKSYDIYFAPKAPKGMESNWIQTIPGKSWFIILRMYGPLEPWLNKTWRPSELELVM